MPTAPIRSRPRAWSQDFGEQPDQTTAALRTRRRATRARSLGIATRQKRSSPATLTRRPPWTNPRCESAHIAVPRHCCSRGRAERSGHPRCVPGIARRGPVVAGAARKPAERSKPRGLSEDQMAASSRVRPPSASLIVRSLSKPPVSAHNSWNASVRSTRPDTPICRHFCILGAADLLLAMQKVEGSNPISRFPGQALLA